MEDLRIIDVLKMRGIRTEDFYNRMREWGVDLTNDGLYKYISDHTHSYGRDDVWEIIPDVIVELEDEIKWQVRKR